MNTISQTPNNTPWRHHQAPDMTLRIRQRIAQLEREERERIVNREDERYERPRDKYQPQGRQWPLAILTIGIIGVVLYGIFRAI